MLKTAISTVALTVAILYPSASVVAKEGDILLRVRAIAVVPNDDSGSILPAFSGEGVSIDTAFAPEVDITYMVADNVGLELIAATTKHTASGETGVTGGIGELASTWVLPPTLTLQYHFAPEAKVRPYIGAGVNYTLFYSEKADANLEAAVGDTDVNLSSSFGFALQAGIDIQLNDRMFMNFDAKYIDMDTKARLSTANAGVQRVDIDINPFVFGVGIGFKL
ncbi:OmpW family protein [Pacificimonas sp. WHA3]|uniref:OmpW family protein n=1 Tax=Pacificimonas pallii TaxID=2827236 RepID=A0ABS6SBX7_9SPHN|nr:OmpW family outer membrane protein [Pacificimonas pallii]MBV7255927.1 OmpW family protein [Pacificimonas pallii]